MTKLCATTISLWIADSQLPCTNLPQQNCCHTESKVNIMLSVAVVFLTRRNNDGNITDKKGTANLP